MNARKEYYESLTNSDYWIRIGEIIGDYLSKSKYYYLFPNKYLGRDSPSISSDYLENPRASSACIGMQRPLVDIRLSNIQQTTNPLIARPLSEKC